MKISLFPKEFIHLVTVEIIAPKEGYYVVSLLDIQGKILRMLGVDLSIGVNFFRLDRLEVLSSGIYYFHVAGESGKPIYSTELIKQ
jgi:hypothetical protein